MCYLKSGEMRDGFHFDSIVWPFNKYDAIDVVVNKHLKDECVKYINKHKIEQARIVMPDLKMLYECPGLRKLNVSPSYNAPENFDFSPLYAMEKLEFLELCGSNLLPNLHFLGSLKNLKTFIFDYNVLDGDITPCLGISYVYCMRGRKHYNLKDKDLPKGEYVRGNEDIEEWRRLE